MLGALAQVLALTLAPAQALILIPAVWMPLSDLQTPIDLQALLASSTWGEVEQGSVATGGDNTFPGHCTGLVALCQTELQVAVLENLLLWRSVAQINKFA